MSLLILSLGLGGSNLMLRLLGCSQLVIIDAVLILELGEHLLVLHSQVGNLSRLKRR